jgi:hypothetical protein
VISLRLEEIPGNVIANLQSRLARVLFLFEVDPHQFSPRPCSTCEEISGIAGKPFGCNRKRAALAPRETEGSK